MNARLTLAEIKAGTARGMPSAALSTRLPKLVGGPVDLARRLSNMKLAFIGAGSIGSRCLDHFARLRIGAAYVVEPKAFKPESLITHAVLPRDCGRGGNKGLWAARRVKAISPATRVFCFPGPLQDLPLDALAAADYWILATDNLPAELEAGVRATRLGVPLVQAAVHPPSLVCQVRFWLNQDGGSCPGCGFNAREWELLNQQARFSCEGSSLPPAQPPTSSLSSLCSLAADLAVHAVLRHRLELGRSTRDACETFCVYNGEFSRNALPRNPNCRCEHLRYGRIETPRKLAEYTLRELAHLAAAPAAHTVALESLSWVARGVCHCPDLARVGRFHPTASLVTGRCRRCQGEIRPHPFHSFEEVPSRLLRTASGVPLARLGVKHPRFAVIRHEQGATLFRSKTRQEPLI